MSDFTGLAIAGRIATPNDSDWDQARLAWNLAADLRPEAVAFVESAGDVAKTVRFAAENELKVSGQGTGHGAAPLAPLEGTILIKTERMRGIEVDPEAQTARVEAGVLVAELSSAAGAHRLSSMPGSSPDVGVTGYTLGGGLSWLGRRYGFACNRVQAIELVTADGEQRTVDAENEPDLFWALRGGGGGYAIVTALQLRLIPIAEIYAGALVFPAELGAEAVRAYRDWAAGVSDDVTSVVRFVTPPPIPDVPEPIRGRPLLTIDGACIGSQAEGEAIVAPLRELGETIMDTWVQIPAEGLKPGDVVRVMQLPGENQAPAAGSTEPAATVLVDRATVYAAAEDPAQSGGTLLTLVVPAKTAPQVAVAGAAGRVAVIAVRP